MTIDGFWNEVSKKIDLNKHRVTFRDYAYEFYHKNQRFLNVGIDIFQWIFEHGCSVEGGLEQSRGITSLSENEHVIALIVAGISSKLKTLTGLPINFVIVFDGKLKNEKMRWSRVEEEHSSLIFEKKYREGLDYVRSNQHITKGKCVEAVMKLLEAWNVSYIVAPGDGEIELARLNDAGIIDAIISNDADSFAYGAKTILRNYSRYKEDKPASGRSTERLNLEYMVTPVTMKMLNEINLDTHKIMFIACCQGDDFSKGISSMGIKKAWALATIEVKDFDPVHELRNIYVSKNKLDYIQGKLPYGYEQRKRLLKDYQEKLKQSIKDHGRLYFGRVTASNITLPRDYIFASHYYPHFAPMIFKHRHTDTNMLELQGSLPVAISLPELPQPLSVKSVHGSRIYVKCGNNSTYPEHVMEFTDYVSGPQIENFNSDYYHWFERIKYNAIFTLTKSNKSNLEGMEYVSDYLGGSFVWRAILNKEKLGLETSSVFIKATKVVKFSSQEATFYQVKYYPRKIFKKLLNLPDFRLDENFNEIQDKIEHVWLPEQLLKSHCNGIEIIRYYKANKTPGSTDKKLSKTKNVTPQKATLDYYSKTDKSPITILNKSLPVLNIFNASKHNLEDRSVGTSPSKKLKLGQVEGRLFQRNHSIVIPLNDKIGNTGIIDKAQTPDDPETYRVLNNANTANIGQLNESFLNLTDDEADISSELSFTKFLNDAKAKDKADQRHFEVTPASEVSDKKSTNSSKLVSTLGNNDTFGRKHLEKNNNAVLRGPSFMDQVTRLQEVPAGPVTSETDFSFEDDSEIKHVLLGLKGKQHGDDKEIAQTHTQEKIDLTSDDPFDDDSTFLRGIDNLESNLQTKPQNILPAKNSGNDNIYEINGPGKCISEQVGEYNVDLTILTPSREFEGNEGGDRCNEIPLGSHNTFIEIEADDYATEAKSCFSASMVDITTEYRKSGITSVEDKSHNNPPFYSAKDSSGNVLLAENTSDDDLSML